MFSAEEQAYLVVPDVEPVRAFLNNALTSKIKGDKAQYELVVNQLRVRDDPETLWKILVAMCNFSYLLTKQTDVYRALLNGIFSYDWRCEGKVSVAMIHLISHIVSTNSTFLGRAFQLYVKSLLPPMTTTLSSETVEEGMKEKHRLLHRAIRGLLGQVPTGRSVLFPILMEFFPHKRFSRNVQTEYVSQLLQICTYEPSLQLNILRLITSRCLEMDVEIVIEDTGEVYIDRESDGAGDGGVDGGEGQLDRGLDLGDLDESDMFRMDAEAGAAGVKSTASFVGKSRRMAVKPKIIAVSRGSSSSGAGVDGSLSSLNNIHLLKNNNTSKALKQLTAAENHSRIPSEVSEMADKLDAILVLIVEFCYAHIADSRYQEQQQQAVSSTINSSTSVSSVSRSSASLTTTERVLQNLLEIFETCILTIHKSKFVQFCIFYAASLNSTFAEAVANKLYSIMCSNKASVSQRQSAVMYLSSYLSRANFLSRNFVGETMDRLVTWAGKYIQQSHIQSGRTGSSNIGTAAASTKGDVDFDEFGRAYYKAHTIERHELLYSVVQSTCYVMCFHGVDMAFRQRNNAQIRAHWEFLVTSHLDPLRYCLKSIRIEFIKLAAAVSLFSNDCWDQLSTDLLYTEVLQQHMNGAATTTLAASVADHDDDVNDGVSTVANTTADNATTTTFTTNDAASWQSVGAGSTAAGGAISRSGSNSGKEVSSSSAPHHSGTTNQPQQQNGLDSFFPFDPCLLCKLHQKIEGSYRVWDGVPGLEALIRDQQEHDDEEEEEEEEEEEDDGSSSCSSDDAESNEEDEEELGNMHLRKKSRSPSAPIQIEISTANQARTAAGATTPAAANIPSRRSDSNPNFTTSSLSSVVSSLAQTDAADDGGGGTAMSVGSAHYLSATSSRGHSPMIASVVDGAAAAASYERGPEHPNPLTRPQDSFTSLLDANNEESDDDDDDDDDEGIHEEHMHIPASQLMPGHGHNNNDDDDDDCSNADNQQLTGTRRPRFYSIGSQGSW